MSKSLKSEIAALPYDELEGIQKLVSELLLYSKTNSNLEQRIFDARFPAHVVCPHCGSVLVVKNGKVRNKQRYMCKDCHKTFGLFTNTMISHSNLPVNIWADMAKSMLNPKNTLRDVAKKLDISVTTAFKMRHKIMKGLTLETDNVFLSGTVQADETYIPDNYKGNHTKSKSFKMPRPAYKRGGQRHMVFTDKSCVVTAMDNGNNILISNQGFGNANSLKLTAALYERFGSDAVLVTDGQKSYVDLAWDNGCFDHVIINTKTHKPSKSGYNLNQINNLHSQIKNYVHIFKGVATKYLDEYLTWFLWCQRTKHIDDIERYQMLLSESIVPI